jgi:hypothetical protein
MRPPSQGWRFQKSGAQRWNRANRWQGKRSCESPSELACTARRNWKSVQRWYGHGHGHGIFILATHPEGAWTTNPKPSFTQRRPNKSTGISRHAGIVSASELVLLNFEKIAQSQMTVTVAATVTEYIVNINKKCRRPNPSPSFATVTVTVTDYFCRMMSILLKSKGNDQ